MVRPWNREEVRKRFFRKFKIVDSGCWEWIPSGLKAGYGQFRVLGEQLAHRVSYILFRGDPGEMFVCHHCDNPKCVNPEHLFLGLPIDNSQDMVKKGRATRHMCEITHCPKGHPYDEKNTYFAKAGNR